MPFVVDASVTACWAFEDEDHPLASVAFERMQTDEALVPALWWFEVRTTLIVGERRGRIAARETTDFLREIARFRITIDRAPEEAELLTLSRRLRLTVYDAAYLELARRTGLPLVSLDADLIRAARTEGVSVLGFES